MGFTSTRGPVKVVGFNWCQLEFYLVSLSGFFIWILTGFSTGFFFRPGYDDQGVVDDEGHFHGWYRFIQWRNMVGLIGGAHKLLGAHLMYFFFFYYWAARPPYGYATVFI